MGLYSAKRLCKEEGMVLEKIYREPTEEKIYNGQKIEAQPERFYVTCASSSNFDKDNGFNEGLYLQYKVDKELFEKLKFGTKVLVTCDVSGERPRAVSVELLEK